MAGYSLGSARGKIEIDASDAVKGADSASDAVDKLGKKAEDNSAALGNIGKAAAGLGALVVGGLGIAVKSAADFEAGLSAIKAVSGATAEEMSKVRDAALRIGKDTSFSASEAAAAFEELIKAGVSVEDALGGAADATVNLAAAGGIALPDAATIAANALNAFNLEATDMVKVADLIAGAANASAIDVGEFGQSLQQSAAVANLAGLDFDDLAVAIAAMGNAGIKGSDAGTSLKTMLQNLQPQTDKQKEKFKELNLVTQDTTKAQQFLTNKGFKNTGKTLDEIIPSFEEYLDVQGYAAAGSKKNSDEAKRLATSLTTTTNAFYDANGSVKSFADISQVLQDALKGQTDQQKQANLEVLFGSDAIRAAAIAADNGAKGINDLALAMGKVSAADTARTRLDNFKGAIEGLKGSAETLAITIGTPLLGALRGLVDGIGGLLDGMTTAVSTGIKRLEDIFAAPALRQKMNELLELFKTVRDTIQLGIDFPEAKFAQQPEFEKFFTFGQTLKTTVDGIRQTLADVKDGFQLPDIKPGAITAPVAGPASIAPDSNAFAFGQAAEKAIKETDFKPIGEALGRALAEAIEGAVAAAGQIAAAIGKLLLAIPWADIGREVGRQVPAFLLGLATGFLNFDIAPIFRFVVDNWLEVLLGLLTIVFLPAKLVTALSKIPFIGGILKWAIEGIQKIGPKLLEVGGDVFKAIFNGLVKGFTLGNVNAAATVTKFIQGILDTFGLKALYLFDEVVKFIGKIPEAMLSMIGKVSETAGLVLRGIFDAFAEAGTFLFTKGIDLITGLTRGSTDQLPVMIKFITEIPRKVLDALGDLLTTLRGPGLNLMKGFGKFIDEGFTVVQKFFVEMPGKILGFIGDVARLLFNTGTSLIRGLLQGIDNIFGTDLAKRFSSMVDDIRRFFGDPVGFLKDAGQKIIDGLIQGIKSKFDAVKGVLGDLTGKITEWKGPEDVDKKLLVGAGELIIGGLINGLENKIPEVKKQLQVITAEIQDTMTGAATANLGTLSAEMGKVQTSAARIQAMRSVPGAMAATGTDSGVNVSFTFQGVTAEDIPKIKTAMTTGGVLTKITQAAKAGRRR